MLAALRTHAAAGDFIVVDCAALWVSNLLLSQVSDIDDIAPEAARAMIDDVDVRARGLASGAYRSMAT